MNFIIENIIYKIQNEDSYESLDIDEMVFALQYCAYKYYNDGQSPITDQQFDSLERYLYLVDKTNQYFIGVGSEVRGEKVNLPYKMGGLTQIEIGQIDKWVTDKNLSNEELIITDKMDGVSCLLIYDNGGNLQIAYSRGDGTMAHDITRHVSKINNVPKKVSGKLVVRAEIEFSNNNFSKIKKIVKSRNNEEYKNARNLVSGIMNAKENNNIVYDYLDFIAYEIIESNENKDDQLRILKNEGFKVVEYSTHIGNKLSDSMLSEYIKARKTALDYEIDGIVIDVNQSSMRVKMNPTRDTLNPAYAIKYKVQDESNLAVVEVLGVEWNISKHGVWKPRVNITATELCGVTVKYATGFNAKFIFENKIGKGAKIKITRAGDVIPHIVGVVSQSEQNIEFPSYNCEWNQTGVDLVEKNYNENDDVIVEQILSFFSTIEAPLLKEGNIRYFYSLNKERYNDSLEPILDMINLDVSVWETYFGENGIKIYNGVKEKLSNISLYKLMGASPCFGFGIGVRKFKKLVNSLKILNIEQVIELNSHNIIFVDSFEEKSADRIIAGLDKFIKFYNNLPSFIKVEFFKESTGTSFKGQTVVFTGFRDKELEVLIETAGGEVKSYVSSKTTLVVAAEPDGNSGKVNKARELGVKIIGVDELKKMLGVTTTVIIKNKKTKEKLDKTELSDIFEF